MSTSTLNKPERKIIEKIRRNQMKDLFTSLFSLIPNPHIMTKEGDLADRVERTIDYIQTLKSNLEMIENKKDKLLSKKRSNEHTEMINSECISLNIQIHEMTHDHDAVLVTGLKTHSSFCNVVRFLDQYSTEVTFANFSNVGHSIFHIREKKIGADDLCKRLKNLVENKNEFGDDKNIIASFCNEIGLI
ncbi:transcription factor bHLH162-like [Bidens hawaiensis]|uniref:transcription factor bHLH162-like n=1 Tax=Bidens hawaiensis TaxID=980011 RepID=UPI004049C7AC